ncbi:cation-transporting P-type ATPase [Ligilactobacillus sp. WILCCON 0076]|uniref:Cation-transporting P-type ATPase n=1 Tax=Ligilactobacillus ubinensis TaxID=2876789 RepID=A0A9X2FK76_9LACO|nr:cation-transporting P-type ATPase [Ligilactobacillus ubinensis]MCP0886704.1 cation-transporting P-type ATPase [Ligilactobacillus ubinensis]
MENEKRDFVTTIAQLTDDATIYNQLDTTKNGLSAQAVEKRQVKYGKNILREAKGEPLWLKFVKNFTSLMAILLWVAGLISFVADLTELGIAIWAVNIINGCFSFWQEYRAGKATAALKDMLPAYTRVIRENEEKKILAQELVPGDIVKLEEGDDIPADIRLIHATDVRVDQSTLTGEVNPVSKDARAIKDVTGNHADLRNTIFSGTSMLKGNAIGIVVVTGMSTDFGKIADLTQNVKEDISPLQKELNVLTRQLSALAITIGIAFFLLATFVVHYPVVKAFVFGLGMIVAFIPEGLLPTVTLSLAGAVQRMAQKNALVKKLASVETLGSASVICSDKTGTLTQNQMTVNHLWTTKHSYTVSGEGYEPKGKILEGPKEVKAVDTPDLFELLRGALLADNAKIVAPNEHHKRYQILGDPTEACLEVAASKGGINPELERKVATRIKELPFDSDRKMMTVIEQRVTERKFDTFTKGAPNCVLKQCNSYLEDGKVKTLTAEIRQKIMAANDGYAKQGLRVLAVACQELPTQYRTEIEKATLENVEKNMIFVGLTVMFDPPRKEVRAAAKLCHKAKIKIIMVTGDYSLTAESIARNIGIVPADAAVKVITGEELKEMSDNELKQALKGEIVFARMAPEQKYRVVTNLQQMGEVVAVTGDGVNDAPALKKADIGVAMGITGTDVAKEAADMILTDDNFASIVTAIKEGRGVYSNIRKFLLYILNSNMPEAVPSVLFLLSGGLIPLPLTIMQILSIDLGTDMLPALGLGKEYAEDSVMEKPPRSLKQHLINRKLLLKAFCWYGLWASIISTGAYFFSNYFSGYIFPHLANSGTAYAQATTVTLGAIIFCQIAAVLNCRYEKESMFQRYFWNNSLIFAGIIFEVVLFLALTYVPILQAVFGTAPLEYRDWLFLICIPFPLILIDEIRKLFVRKRLI